MPGLSDPTNVGHSEPVRMQTVEHENIVSGKENQSGISIGDVMLHKMKGFPYWPVMITDIKGRR
jgi:hypothetical protein